MISSKTDLRAYLAQDKEQLGRTYTTPHILGDEVWKFQIALRKLEYYNNVRGGYYTLP